MEETQVDASSPPAAATPDTAPPAFEADHAAELAADYSNIDALIEQARVAVEAEGSEDEGQPGRTSTPAPSSPPSDDGEHERAAALLKERGYEVTSPSPPPPPPDGYEALQAQLEPLVGTASEYLAAREAALAPLPPLPSDTDPDWQAKFDAHQHAVGLQNEAAAQLRQYDRAREVSGTARQWARGRVLGELGAALETIASQYGLSPEQAKRVTQPTAMTDAVAAVVEARDAVWQSRIDELTKHWQGEVKRAGVDRTQGRFDALGRGAQPAGPPAGRPADGRLAALLGGTARPDDLSEDIIERAMRGELARADLGE